MRDRLEGGAAAAAEEEEEEERKTWLNLQTIILTNWYCRVRTFGWWNSMLHGQRLLSVLLEITIFEL